MKTTMQFMRFILFAFVLSAFAVSCDDDEPLQQTETPITPTPKPEESLYPEKSMTFVVDGEEIPVGAAFCNNYEGYVLVTASPEKVESIGDMMKFIQVLVLPQSLNQDIDLKKEVLTINAWDGEIEMPIQITSDMLESGTMRLNYDEASGEYTLLMAMTFTDGKKIGVNVSAIMSDPAPEEGNTITINNEQMPIRAQFYMDDEEGNVYLYFTSAKIYYFGEIEKAEDYFCIVLNEDDLTGNEFDITNTDKLAGFKAECKAMGIEVLKPDINESLAKFSVQDGKLRYALGAIKGVGESNMNAIVEAREKGGKFKSLTDFINRVDAKQLNRKQLEQLIKAGAFDCLEKKRGKLFANIDTILKNISSATEMKVSAQSSLFGVEEYSSNVKLFDAPDWPDLEKLRLEAAAIGFYLSAHPLDVYAESMKKLGVKTCQEVMANIRVGDSIKANIAGCVENFQRRTSKNGNKYAYVGLSDTTGNFEGMLFSDGLEKYGEVVISGVPLLVKVTVNKQSEDETPRIMINSVKTLDEAIAEQAKGVVISLDNVAAVSEIRKVLCSDMRGVNKVYLEPELQDWDVRIELSGGYAFSDNMMLSKLKNIPGVVSVKEI